MAQSRDERHPNSSGKGPGQHGQPPIRTRRSLTHVGGAVETEGDPADIQKLEFALQVRPSTDQEDDLTRAHVHGFHSYPARMHPVTAHRLARGFTPMGGRLLDPFCGSGTVLVESMLLGLKPTGFDLNPLAVRLARCKTTPRTDGELNHMVGQASECAAFADDRRKTKAGASRRFGAEDVALFEPHVLLELDSLLEGIRSLGRDPARTDLELVLSSLLVKLSRRQADTSKAVRAIGEIVAVIEKIDGLQTKIAAAVEEQSVTTSEISRNIGEATIGSTEIAQNIGQVAQAAQNTAEGASNAQLSSQELARMAQNLQRLVEEYQK